MSFAARVRSLSGVGSLCVGGLCLVGLTACTSEPTTRNVPGLAPEDVARLPPPPPPAPEQRVVAGEAPTEPTGDPFAEEEPIAGDPGSLMAGTPRGAAGAGAAVVPAAEPKKKERDLGAELQAALGDPIACLDLNQVPEGGGKLRVQVGAYVGPSGRVTRASVSSPGQPAQALSCIEKRVVALKLQDPIEDAPKLVETTLEFQIARAPAPQAPAPTPPPPAPTY